MTVWAQVIRSAILLYATSFSLSTLEDFFKFETSYLTLRLDADLVRPVNINCATYFPY